MVNRSKLDLFIPHKDWSKDPKERVNYSELERWGLAIKPNFLLLKDNGATTIPGTNVETTVTPTQTFTTGQMKISGTHIALNAAVNEVYVINVNGYMGSAVTPSEIIRVRVNGAFLAGINGGASLVATWRVVSKSDYLEISFQQNAGAGASLILSGYVQYLGQS